MRLFTGLAINESVLEKLQPVLNELQALAKLNWSKVENLHITTKFIGEWPETRLDALKSALGDVEKQGPIAIKLRGFGFYPSPSRPRVFFAGVDGGAALPALAAHIENACEAEGCSREDREYSPHLTLAKIRNAKVTSLRDYIAPIANRELGTFTADDFHLYVSKPSAGGSIYTKLASFPLA